MIIIYQKFKLKNLFCGRIHRRFFILNFNFFIAIFILGNGEMWTTFKTTIYGG